MAGIRARAVGLWVLLAVFGCADDERESAVAHGGIDIATILPDVPDDVQAISLLGEELVANQPRAGAH